jgi:hypothetical protein
MQVELNPAALAAIEKVQKLLALARDAGASQGEAQNAMDLATRILEQHNLDIAAVEAKAGRGHSGKRDDRTQTGGLYKWQRQVWKSTASLNMCVYFSLRGLARGSKYEQRIVGRPENVLMTNLMASYLQDAIERNAAAWAKDQGFSSRFVREAVIYREGMADTICYRLNQLRRDRLREAEEKEAAARAAQPAGEPGTSVVLASVIQSEADLNLDYLNGWEPGTTARRRAEADAYWARWDANQKKKAEEKAARRAADPEYDLECKAEEAAEAKREAKSQARYRSRAYSTRETAEDRRRNHWAAHEGREKGYEVGLDPQVTGHSTQRLK